MIKKGTCLKVADNSGAKELRCIDVIGGSRKKKASVGDVIVVSVTNAMPAAVSKVKKGTVYKAVVVRTRYPVSRQDGTVISFDTNSAVLINNQGDIIGTRIFGPVPHEVRKINMKIISLSPEVL